MAKENETKKKNTTTKKVNATKKSASAKKGATKKTTKKVNTSNNVAKKKSDVTKVETKKVDLPKEEMKAEKISEYKEIKQINRKPMKKLPTEESKVVKRFIIVLLVVIASVTAIYFVTRIFVTKDLFNKDSKSDTQEVTFNYDKTILGSTFNRPYDEYYVIAYKSSDEQASFLSTIISDYKAKDEHLKIYYADLDDYMNSSFYDKDNVNKSATNASQLKVGDYTLIKISDKTIAKYIEGVDNIANELQ